MPWAIHRPTTPRIVLVHGAWADGTGWQRVIPLLERDGYPVIAVQNPLTSLADDVATTRRVIEAEAQLGPVVVVAHSYGGAVTTGAAAGVANVKALVYLAAFAPDAGEPGGALLERYPSLLGTALVPDAAGFLYVDRAKFREIFAGDVAETEARVMAAAQKPVAGAIFGQALEAAAWTRHPVVVSRVDARQHPQPGDAALLRPADGGHDQRDRGEPRGVHLAPGRGRRAHRRGDAGGDVARGAATLLKAGVRQPARATVRSGSGRRRR